MTQLTINLDDQLVQRVNAIAAEQGVAVDALVSDILQRGMDDPAKGLIALFARARREGWRSSGPYLTDDEMYSR